MTPSAVGGVPANVVVGSAAPVAFTAGGASSLLPSPDAAGLADVECGLVALYAIQTEQSTLSARDAENGIRSKQVASRAELELFKAAMRRQQDAEQKAKGFWSKFKKVATTVAKIAGVVAGVAAVACSGGAALPLAVGIAGVALSGGGTAIRELKLLGKDSDKVGMWMEAGGAALGFGAAAAAALGITTLAVNGGSTTMRAVGSGATVVDAAGTGGSAVATIAIADLQNDADHAAADRESASLAIEQLGDDVTRLIRSAEAAASLAKEAVLSTRNALEACNQAADVAIAGVKG